ncbi:hypothetical protein [Streptomyces noursei]|uniref:Uncharacterized protein n=1 Tax=Streptomyces noursei TaxID=1971 RepID=A0A2N8PFP7_STRNR|nr:hypothetical protein [Streptomyces noursei]PNE39836.1 hypothetical protein AOB60_01360 [Streptomyces noursei]
MPLCYRKRFLAAIRVEGLHQWSLVEQAQIYLAFVSLVAQGRHGVCPEIAGWMAFARDAP